MNDPTLPTRRLPANPDLNQLKRQAKELLVEIRAADPKSTAALHDAQLALARDYGFPGWPKLKARVDGVTVERLAHAIRAGDLKQATSMLKARPELAGMSFSDLTLLHHAVLNRHPELVRLLIKHGANPHIGIYPHRDITSAIQVAAERGYDDILQAIRESESVNRNPEPREAPDPQGPLTTAVKENRLDELKRLLDQGCDPDERTRVPNSDEIEFSWGSPLWHAAGSGQYEMAQLLLARGADPNGRVYASGSPMFQAISQRDEKMIALIREHGGLPEATAAGLFRLTDLARKILAGEAPCKLDGVGGDTAAEQLLWGGACGGDPEIVRMALTQVDWPRDDPRWFKILEQPLRVWHYGTGIDSWDRATYPTCLELILERCDPNLQGRFGLTILHSAASTRPHITADERVAFATLLLAAGARLDIRDGLFAKTPIEWAERANRHELLELYRREV